MKCRPMWTRIIRLKTILVADSSENCNKYSDCDIAYLVAQKMTGHLLVCVAGNKFGNDLWIHTCRTFTDLAIIQTKRASL
jgi:hypothetical protein